MGRKSKLYWILMIIISAGVVLGVENFIKSYFAREEKEIAKYMGSNIYIDPNDTDTIYLDFGGLWEMKRDKQNYSTSGKSLTGKG